MPDRRKTMAARLRLGTRQVRPFVFLAIAVSLSGCNNPSPTAAQSVEDVVGQLKAAGIRCEIQTGTAVPTAVPFVEEEGICSNDSYVIPVWVFGDDQTMDEWVGSLPEHQVSDLLMGPNWATRPPTQAVRMKMANELGPTAPPSGGEG